MPGEGPPLPTKFPCLVKAIYSWGGETKRDLGFVEGDLIECLNAGDGQWWMGRLRRNKTVGLFPSNFVEVIDEYGQPAHSRAPSPMPGMGGSISRAASPAPMHPRAPSPQPPAHGLYNGGGGGSSRSRTGRSPSPAPYHNGHMSRAPSPNPYGRSVSPNPYHRSASPNPHMRAVSPNPYMRAASPAPSMRSTRHDYAPRAVSPAPSLRHPVPRAASPAPPTHFRAVSPAPSMRHFQRAASPNPYMKSGHMDETPPPPPPTHRHIHRPTSPLPPPPHHHHDGRLTPTPSRPPSAIGRTPSPLRTAMEDVMESLEQMSTVDDRPRTPQDPWSPAAFGEVYSPNLRKQMRPETSLGFGRRDDYDDEDERGAPHYPENQRPPQLRTYTDKMDDQLRRFQLSNHPSQRRASDDDRPRAPSSNRQSCYANLEQFERPTTASPALRNRKSAYDIRAHSASPTKMIRPRPLSRMESLTTTVSSNNSSSTTRTESTEMTSASIMSGRSAGGFSATSAGSLARHKKAMSVSNFVSGRESPMFINGGYGSKPEPPSGYYGSASGAGSQGSLQQRPRGQTWGASDMEPRSNGVLGGLSTPKPKKSGFFKKLLVSAKTSAASARSVTGSSNSSTPIQFVPRTIPDGVTAISGGRQSMHMNQQGSDWVQVRRDVNRANTYSRNERIERQEKQQMMDQIVLRPVDALDEEVDGDEAADGGIVDNPQDFDTANLALVDKTTRFISSIPPFTTPESLATHHVCRPYKSDVQRLRAIFTWVSEKIAWEHPCNPHDTDLGMQTSIDTRRVLSQKRGSPEEIAALVAGMCAAIQLPCEIIYGYLKTPGESLDLESVPRPNHCWNAVLVDNHEWRFLDCSLASPTHPRRTLYSSTSSSTSEFFYFLTRPSHFCWSHIPLSSPSHQHLVPPLPLPILLSLPVASPPFFRHGLALKDFDTSLTRLEDLEVAQLELLVPSDIELIAEVEAQAFGVDQDGDVFETGEITKKRALSQAMWTNAQKLYRIKAVLPSDEGSGVLKIYAGKRGLMHSIKDNPHPLALSFPITHTGENPPYSFMLRHPTPHAQRHDLYIVQPQCSKLAVNNTFVFAVRQGGGGEAKPAKLGIQTPGGKILRLMKKADTIGSEAGMVWETIIKVGERGPWRALVLADRSARWCVYAEWLVV